MLVIPRSQHYTATMIIVNLRRQMVKLYEKASFLHYSMEIKCTSFRFSDDYSYSLLIIWQCPLPDDTIRT
jgi:hypothetical protein